MTVPRGANHAMLGSLKDRAAGREKFPKPGRTAGSGCKKDNFQRDFYEFLSLFRTPFTPSTSPPSPRSSPPTFPRNVSVDLPSSPPPHLPATSGSRAGFSSSPLPPSSPLTPSSPGPPSLSAGVQNPFANLHIRFYINQLGDNPYTEHDFFPPHSFLTATVYARSSYLADATSSQTRKS